MSATRKTLIAGNWKMNMNVGQASQFVHRFQRKFTSYRNVDVAIFPTMLALQPISHEVDKKRLKLGAQNFHYEDHDGTFTGEVSATMLKDMIEYGIVGHSERRRKMNESDEVVSWKMAAAHRNNITPILCVGEDKVQRLAGETNRVLHDQLHSNLATLTAEEVGQSVIAYEPLWAISSGDGHGDYALPEPVGKAAATIRHNVAEMFGAEAAEQVLVLYGGSVNPDNAASYMRIKDIDGYLVGGASLNYISFYQIIEAVHRVLSE